MRRPRSRRLGFAVLVVAVAARAVRLHALPDVSSSGSSRVYLIALARPEHADRLHRARSRSVTARSWASAPTRRRSSSSTTAGATSGRSRSRASSPALFGLAFGLPATRFAGPYLALATFAIPLSFIGILKRFPHFTGGNVGKNLPQLHAAARRPREPVGLVLRRHVGRRAGHAAARVPASCAGGSAARCARCATARSRRPRTASRRRRCKTAAFGISAFYCGVAGALYAIGITYVNPDTFPIELSILLLVGIVIGGAGSLYGHALRRGLRRVHPDQLGPGAARPGLAHPPHQHAPGTGRSRDLRRLRRGCLAGRPRASRVPPASRAATPSDPAGPRSLNRLLVRPGLV